MSDLTPEKRPAEEPVAEEQAAKKAKVEEPVGEAPVVEEPVQEPVAEEPAAEEPAAEEPVAEEPQAENEQVEAAPVEEPVAETAPVVEEEQVEEQVEQVEAAEEVEVEAEAAEEDESFSVEDFPDLELTPQQVEEYNALYQKFAEHCEAESDARNGMAMVLKNAAEIRPLPQSLEEMKNAIPHVIVPHEQYKYKLLLEEKLSDAIEEEGMKGEEKYAAEVKEAGMEEGADLPEERAELLGAEMHRNIAKRSLDIINESMNDSEAMLAKQKPKGAFFTCVVTTDLIVAAREQICLVESEADGDRLEKTLLRLKSIWQKSFEASNEDLELNDFYRAHVKGWLGWVHECLKNGEVIPDVKIEYFDVCA